MSEWNESFLGQYQQFQGNEAEKKSAELAALQRKQAASGGQTSAEAEKRPLSPEEAREKRLLEHWASVL